MNDQDFLSDTDGDTSALLVPNKSELAYVAPNEIPDLESAEVGFSLEAKYLKFSQPQQTVRAIFNGFTTIRKNEGGEIKPMTAAVLQNKEGLFLNATSNILDQLSRIPAGTAIQITYIGDEKTASGYNVKKFDIRVLNIKTTPTFTGASGTEKPAQSFPKIQYKNMDKRDDYWKMANQLRLTNEEGNEHLREFGYDFAAALEALTPDFAQ